MHPHRLSVTEHKPDLGRQENRRQDDCTAPVYVLERVEGNAACLVGGVVAEMAGGKAMRGFMQSDRDDHRYGVNRDAQGDLWPAQDHALQAGLAASFRFARR